MIDHTQPSLLYSASSDLRQVFTSVEVSSCPNSLNFHLHTTYSDGRLQPEDIVSQAIALRMSALAITDHHTIDGYQIALNFLNNFAKTKSHSSNLPQLWVGVEMTASLLFTEVHILGYSFNPNHEAMQPYLQGKETAGIDYQARSVINALHCAGGLAVLAHPARYRRSPADLIPAAAALGIDGIETYYSYDNSDPWRPSPRQTEHIHYLGDRYNLLHTCGTDSHGLNITKRM